MGNEQRWWLLRTSNAVWDEQDLAGEPPFYDNDDMMMWQVREVGEIHTDMRGNISTFPFSGLFITNDEGVVAGAIQPGEIYTVWVRVHDERDER